MNKFQKRRGRIMKTGIIFLCLVILIVIARCGKEEQSPRAIPQVGEKAPDFTLPNDQGSETRLSDFQGNKTIVLYFYPKDDTPACTREAYEFTQNQSKFDSLGVEILGVSVDGIASHKAFREKFDINFILLSDSTKRMSKAYGVLNEGGYDNRTTFIIDKQGMIKAVFENVQVDGHAEEVLAALP
jgi:peroxiredoxin Q/BCP